MLGRLGSENLPTMMVLFGVGPLDGAGAWPSRAGFKVVAAAVVRRADVVERSTIGVGQETFAVVSRGVVRGSK
jgi:hypothetical protein